MRIESAPAKLTLTLRMKEKRDDGFNNLEALTVFLPEISDSLETSSTGMPLLTVENIDGSHSELKSDDSNLVAQAFQQFIHHEKIQGKFPEIEEASFYLLKMIPMAAGLGGGSADAGATLRSLNEMCGNVLTMTELASLGEQLGSDVPACVHSEALWMRGRGERVEILGDVTSGVFANMSVLVITPEIHCATPDVYRRFEELGRPIDDGISSPEYLSEITPTLHNDLALGAFDLFPELVQFKNELEKCLGQSCVLAGSGSTFFVLDTFEKIDLLYNKVKDDQYFDGVRLCATSTIC